MTEANATISGPIFVAGVNVRSDDIISPAYLSFDLDDPAQRRILAAYTFSDFETSTATPLIEPGSQDRAFRILVAGDRFGRGSARRHPAVAIGEARVHAIVARSYDDSFERYCADEGLTLPLRAPDLPDELLNDSHPLTGTIDLDGLEFRVNETGLSIPVEDPGVLRSIWERGGITSLWNEPQ